MRPLLLALLAASAFACGNSSYGDAGSEATNLPPMTYDVDQSGVDAGNIPVCPPGLYSTESQSPGNAVCTMAPEQCVSSTDGGPNAIHCYCTAPSGSTNGTWTCGSM